MEDSGRPYFTFMRSYYEAIEQCPEGVQLELYRAIALYGLNKIEPEGMSPLSSTLWKLIQPVLAKQWCKFENGSKGGCPTGAKKPSMAGNQNAKKTKPNQNLNQTKTKPTSSKDKEKDKEKELEKEKDKDNTSNEVVVYDASRPLSLFEGWLKKECPYIFSHYKLLTEAELEKLKAEYGYEAIADVCQQIENRKDLRSKYVNLYRTLRNWLERNEKSGTSQNRADDASKIIERLAAEDDEKAIRQARFQRSIEERLDASFRESRGKIAEKQTVMEAAAAISGLLADNE